MKTEIVAQELIHLLDAAKSDMVVGLKLREASLLKLMLGQYLLFYACSCLFISFHIIGSIFGIFAINHSI